MDAKSGADASGAIILRRWDEVTQNVYQYYSDASRRARVAHLPKTTFHRLSAGKAPLVLNKVFQVCYANAMTREATLAMLADALDAWIVAAAPGLPMGDPAIRRECLPEWG